MDKIKIKLNNNIFNILNTNLYTKNYIDDFEFDEYNEIDEAIKKISYKIIDESLKKILKNYKINVFNVYHPRYYNYEGDEVDFYLYIDQKEFFELEKKTTKNPEFKKFLKNNYYSYDGYVCNMASDLEKFEKQKNDFKISQLLKFYISDDKIIENNQEFDELLYDYLLENFNIIDE